MRTVSRAPAERDRRGQILAAARRQFGHAGYEKTTVSDVARDIGFSKAYIYKFFVSKHAIAEAINEESLHELERQVDDALAYSVTPSERLRALFSTLVAGSAHLFDAERPIFDISATSAEEGWRSYRDHEGVIRSRLRSILEDGRRTGAFEAETLLDEVVRAIFQMMQPFANPSMLRHNLGVLPAGLTEAASLALRSLAG